MIFVVFLKIFRKIKKIFKSDLYLKSYDNFKIYHIKNHNVKNKNLSPPRDFKI